jgi:hypothetical protein
VPLQRRHQGLLAVRAQRLDKALADQPVMTQVIRHQRWPAGPGLQQAVDDADRAVRMYGVQTWWPVIAARSAFWADARSRTSPIMIVSGSSRIAFEIAARTGAHARLPIRHS